jgi:hypothetical protein
MHIAVRPKVLARRFSIVGVSNKPRAVLMMPLLKGKLRQRRHFCDVRIGLHTKSRIFIRTLRNVRRSRTVKLYPPEAQNLSWPPVLERNRPNQTLLFRQ